MFLAIEICLTAICLALAYTHPPLGDKFFEPVERRFAKFAEHRNLAFVSVGLFALAIRAALLPILHIPAPCIHDEFSHLLLADTLAHGRLANPTHPMWMHFETFHVNWHPTYGSMYYPGNALFLALGQVVLGHPFWGVWLSSGLMCAAICWALQGWMPPKWALLGALLALIRIGTFSYWADSYWGGTPAAFGGALVLGAFPRIKERPNIRDSALLGFGMVVLALTRPYEGMFFCLPIGIALIVWAARDSSPSLRVLFPRVAVPSLLVLSVGIAWLGYYFWRVTGSPFTTPYEINIRAYGLIYFLWETIKPVAPFHHQMMQLFYRDLTLKMEYDLAHKHPFELQGLKFLGSWLFYFGPILTAPWLAWLGTRKQKPLQKISPEVRLLMVLCLSTWISTTLTIYVGQPHYAAPLTATFYAATMLVMRDLRSSWSGRWLVRSIALVCGLLFILAVVTRSAHLEDQPSWARIWCTPSFQNMQRARILDQLEQMPGQQLAIVRYKPGHDFSYDEWVYNGADIDGAKVLWARDMGSRNAELLDYFRGRQVWLVEPDYSPARLSRYSQ